MIFTHDTEVALQGAAALVNTRAADEGGTGEDTLTRVVDLDTFVRDFRWSGSRTRDRAELDAVRAARGLLGRFWELDEAEVVAHVNGLLAQAQAVPRLVDHDDWGWHLHATPDDAPLATRMVVEAAMAVVDVVRAGELQRLRRCEAEGCADVYVDLSRNRSKRFCSTTCGNRVAAAAYRERQAGGSGAGGSGAGGSGEAG